MKEKDKTKEHLLDELAKLRRRISKLEKLETDRKRTENELRVRDWAIKSAISAIALADLEGKLIYVNDSFLKLWDYDSEKEVLGKPSLKFWQTEKTAKQVVKALRNKGSWIGELTAIRKDGSPFDVQLSASMVSDETGNPICMMASFLDITERKQAEEALREGEKSYRELANSISDVFFEMDKDLRYSYWNKASENLTGISADQALGKSLYEIFPEARGTKAEKLYLKALRTHQPISFVNEHQLNGQNFFFDINAYPSKRGLSVFVKDITEQKLAEQELKASEERYKDLVEKADIAILIDDKDGQFQYFNEKYADLFGYSVEEMKKQAIQSIVHPDDVDRVLRFHKERLQGKKVPSRYEFKGVKKDGTPLYLEVDAVKLKEGKKIIGTRSYIWDITARKQSEGILRESEEKFRNLAEQSPNMIFINHKGRVVYANKKCEEIMGYEREEFYSPDFDFMTLIAPEHRDKVKFIFTRHMKGKEFPPYDYSLITKEGKKIEAIITTKLISYEGDRAILGIITDITERKTAEEQIKASLKEKEVLLKEIHHRVKNNMQITSSLLNLQSRYVKDRQAQKIFKDSQNRVKSMALIHERLYQSKDLSSIDFAEYARSLIGHLFSSYGIDPRTIKYKVNIKDMFLDLNTAIPCGLIINELVSNALKHAFLDGKKGEIKIALHPLNKKEIELIVSDNGSGLPDDTDFRSTKSLGLHLVTILAEDQLKGSIKLDKSKGTSFQMKLRIKQ